MTPPLEPSERCQPKATSLVLAILHLTGAKHLAPHTEEWVHRQGGRWPRLPPKLPCIEISENLSVSGTLHDAPSPSQTRK